MNDVNMALDAILSGFFWLVLLIVVAVFGFGFVKTQANRFLPKGPGGTFQTLDGALMDRVSMLGQKSDVRHIGKEKEARATLGIRLVMPVAVVLIGYFAFSDVMGDKSAYSAAIEFGIYAFVVYLTAYVWAFSMQYDQDAITLRNRFLMQERHNLRDLDSITMTQQGTYKLWFDDGSKVEVPKHITNSAGFYRDMREVIARNVA